MRILLRRDVVIRRILGSADRYGATIHDTSVDYSCFEILIPRQFLNGQDVIELRLFHQGDLASVALGAAVLPHYPASQEIRGLVTLLSGNIGFCPAFLV
jgi:hypothetical protein